MSHLPVIIGRHKPELLAIQSGSSVLSDPKICLWALIRELLVTSQVSGEAGRAGELRFSANIAPVTVGG